MRLRDMARMLDRLDRLESGTGEWLAAQGDGALQEAATDMTLRALRAAADPTNFAILAFLSAQTSAPTGDTHVGRYVQHKSVQVRGMAHTRLKALQTRALVYHKHRRPKP